MRYYFYECDNPDCGLRFPGPDGGLRADRCPRCKQPVRQAAVLDLQQEAEERPSLAGEVVFEALLDNIRSAWNVGSMFRTADGVGFRKLYLCGYTPGPEHPQVGRTALGAHEVIAWEQAANGVEKASHLKALGYRLWGLEDLPGAVPLYRSASLLPGPPVVLVVGNEVSGIDPGILGLCDQVLSIPMTGVKRSYNVAVAFGIASSFLRYCCQIDSQGSLSRLPKT
ncbi:MAG TPA: RNA methyltransferase [Anaerolineales bacterium]|nr:RNA methyltransferase [Anaerolineales bacterium]